MIFKLQSLVSPPVLFIIIDAGKKDPDFTVRITTLPGVEFDNSRIAQAAPKADITG
ncbi:hypothetical protein D3C85_1753170 [compost metagenome]